MSPKARAKESFVYDSMTRLQYNNREVPCQGNLTYFHDYILLIS
jgi:hypothetical protein